MKQFIAFVKKEFYHIFRDRRTMLILLGMPVVEIILFGFAISTEVKNVRLAVLDPSNDVVTRKIIDRLMRVNIFRLLPAFILRRKWRLPSGKIRLIWRLYLESVLPTDFIREMPVCS